MANSDIIKIGFDYRASLAQFEKDTNGVFDGISNKAGKQRITIQLDAKDDKVIDKIKELQKLKLDKFTFEFGDSGLKEQLQTFDKLENKINEIINLGKGKSFIDSSPTVTDIGKIENKINELNKKYEEAQKKLSSIGSGDISGKDVNLVDNAEFQKLTQEVSKLKNQFDDLKIHIQLLDDCTVPTDRFFELQSQVETTTVKVSDLVEEFAKLSNAQKTLSSTPQESNISSGMKDAFPKTSENLEQVTQSEQKVQQEAVATDKALDNISFTPNTEGFDDIIAKFGILREQAEQITKIVKTTKQTADGADISYKATLKNGSSYYLGENSTPQVLNANETVYDSKAIEKAYQEATKVNNALNETNSLLNSLKVPNGFEGSFSTLESEIKRLNSEFGSGKISATEYANSIKKAFSNYQTPIDNRSKDIWNELTTSLDRYATLQKRIASNNALSTDNEEATKLLEHIHELQRNDILPAEKLTVSNEKLQQINQTVADLKAKLKESTLDSLQGSIDKYQKIYNQRSTYSSDFTPSEQYTKNLTELETAIKKLVEYKNALKNVGEVTVEQERHLKGLVAACEKASDSFKSLSASEKGASQIAIDKLVHRINKDLDECTNYSKEAKLGLRALRDELESANPRNLKEITSEIINIENEEIRAGRAGRSFFDTLKNSGFHQLAAQISGMFGFYYFINLGKRAISVIVDLDDALLDLKKTTSMSSTELNNFYYSANDVAKQMGVTTKSIIEQASAWSRLGYSSNEQATEMAKLSSKFASISPGMDTDQAQEGMVSIMKAWQINPEDVEKEILDPINRLGNKFAESNDDIVEGMKRSAAALAAVGTDYKDAYSLFTGIQEVLQNSEVAGRALRSISMRIRGYDENSEDGFEQTDEELKNITGDLIDLTKTAEHSQGVSIFKEGSTTEFKSLVDYFGEIHDIWDEMSQKQQNDFLQKAFGKTQAQAGSALIQNYDAVKASLAEIDESAGSADKEMSIVEQTLSYKINALKETWVGCTQQILDRGDLGIAISGLNGVLKVITGLIDNVGLLKTAAMGVAAALSFKNVGIDTLVAY